MSRLSSLTSLTSLTLSASFDSWEDPPGLLRLLHAGCTDLQELSLGGLRAAAHLHLPTLKRLRLMSRHNDVLLPCLDGIPNLVELHIDSWLIEGTAPALREMLALLHRVPCTVALTLSSLKVKCDGLSPCSMLLDSLPPGFTLPSLRYLKCTSLQFDQVAELACCFPALLKLKTAHCELAHTSIMVVVQSFPRLRRWVVDDPHYYFDSFGLAPTVPQQHFLGAVAEAQRVSNNRLLKVKFPKIMRPRL